MKNILKQHGLVPHETSLGFPTKLEARAVLRLGERLRKTVRLEAIEAELGVASRVFGEIVAEGHIHLLVKGDGGVMPLNLAPSPDELAAECQTPNAWHRGPSVRAA
ncbi:hypothetical protein [Mesorhizobium helmanticense]|uniref:Uncharacterized protein n=1 Tax=Mesorhizobium helmanticense TaxID=1776423 RepID=A0A2T4IKY4_9HYPH|nr:hypothetical protein [Mesorhizobium helmanticense]PTE06308.1 hypothetical protein C9427_32460 [Mesorhizobium helmanticense]